jgi:hypothetical protein
MQHFQGEPRETHGILEQLIRLPPKPRILAGIVCLAVGVAATIALWGKGVLWGLTIFFVVAGFLLVLSGISGFFRERNRRAFVEMVETHREEILAAMIDAKRQGQNPVRFLNEKGIHDALVRGALIEEMNQRLRS